MITAAYWKDVLSKQLMVADQDSQSLKTVAQESIENCT
jgi:hypothetical protein